MQILFTILLIITSLVLIASILLQPGKSAGLSGTIAGGAESIWGKNKGRSYEGILEKLTAISAILFVISALVLAALQ
ncbi:preprotein translocase subunit SecG [Caldisalinibacter kiritimatiensis]|uniref:Protein-export membrane protein SecG n=1 Tax=Caldisalinibacter kiritimatiensis TaxID=1304284 RepID=R1AUC3_9FIRM|nr:preprotein translocase subunit SecG [Caldisalinibacter kiritimatiensis]EOD00763.1 Preprotein translocase subunit SecG [Caldisalinibacter kiritimatiensis]